MKQAVIPILVLGLIGIGVFVYSLNNSLEKRESETAQVRDKALEAYVIENINALSPRPSVLGGTFYVTEISAQDGIGRVAYEDGHTAHTADFTYATQEGGAVQITSFVVSDDL